MGIFQAPSHDVPGWCKYCYPSQQETGSPKKSISQPVRRSLRLQKLKEEVEQFHCYSCDLKFDNGKDFTEHKEKVHIEEEDDSVKNDLGNESSGHSSNKKLGRKPQFKCRTCGKVYNQKRNLVRHERTKHSGTVLKCKICDKSFSRKEGLIKHIKEGHGVQCEICEKSFKQKRYLRRHMKTHVATENDRIKCPDCSATFAREDNMKKHQVYKHLDPTHCFKCKICHKIFKHEQSMLRHIRQEHEGSPHKFKCDICDAEFSEKGVLNRHMNNHQGSSKDKVKCPECPLTFSQNSDMKRHLLMIHIDPTLSYICKLCDRVFKHEKNMQSHISQVHEHDVKAFQCSICSKEYTDKSNLNRHMKSHTGQRYECWECPATFARKRDLKLHEKQGEHNYSELNCEFCNETFIFKCWDDEDQHFEYHLGKRSHCIRSRLISHSLCEKCGYQMCRCIPRNYPIVVRGSAEDKADLAEQPVKHYPFSLPEVKTFAEAMSVERRKAQKDFIKQRDKFLSKNYKITLTDVFSQRLREPEKMKKSKYQKWLEGLGYEEKRSLKLFEPNDFWYENEEYRKFKNYHFEDLSQKYYSDWVEKKKNWKRNKSNK